MINDEKLEALKVYLEENLKEKSGPLDEVKNFVFENRVAENIARFASLIIRPESSSKSESLVGNGENADDSIFSIEAWIEEQRKWSQSFRNLLLVYLEEAGYVKDTYSDFYNAIDMDRRMFWKLTSEGYQGVPEKITIFKLIIGLKLNEEKASKLLGAAGHCFNYYVRFDMIIKYCVENSIFDIETVDEYLYEFGEKTLFSLE